MIARFMGGIKDGEEEQIAEPAPLQINAMEPPKPVLYTAERELPDMRPFRTIIYRLAMPPRAGIAYYRVVS